MHECVKLLLAVAQSCGMLQICELPVLGWGRVLSLLSFANLIIADC